MIKITVDEFIKLSRNDILGKVVVFPTDTVYGIGSLVDDSVGVEKIYNLKHRDKTKPLAMLAENIDQIKEHVLIENNETEKLMSYWPGALTLIFKKKEVLEGDLNTIAFRIPDSIVAKKVLKHFGVMKVTSMNLSGEAPLNNIEDIIKNFEEEIDYLIVDEEKHSNISSTIIDVSVNPFVVIRSGELIKKINV